MLVIRVELTRRLFLAFIGVGQRFTNIRIVIQLYVKKKFM